MKRTVKRWMVDPVGCTYGSKEPLSGDKQHEVTMTWDDGTPEPKGCPCDRERDIACCGAKASPNRNCCSHQVNGVWITKVPCLACAPTAKAKTVERVVEGFASPDEPICGMATLAIKQSAVYLNPARLIITEPAPEPTLLEAVEAFIRKDGEGSQHDEWIAMCNATARERARLDKEGK